MDAEESTVLVPNPFSSWSTAWEAKLTRRLSIGLSLMWEMNSFAVLPVPPYTAFAACGAFITIYSDPSSSSKLRTLARLRCGVDLRDVINQMRMLNIGGIWRLVAVWSSGLVSLIDPFNYEKRLLNLFNAQESTWSLTASPSSPLLLVGANSFEVTSFDLSLDKPQSSREVVTQHQNNVPCIDITSCGNFLASISIDNSIQIVHVPTKTKLATTQISAWGWGCKWIRKKDVALVRSENQISWLARLNGNMSDISSLNEADIEHYNLIPRDGSKEEQEKNEKSETKKRRVLRMEEVAIEDFVSLEVMEEEEEDDEDEEDEEDDRRLAIFERVMEMHMANDMANDIEVEAEENGFMDEDADNHGDDLFDDEMDEDGRMDEEEEGEEDGEEEQAFGNDYKQLLDRRVGVELAEEGEEDAINPWAKYQGLKTGREGGEKKKSNLNSSSSSMSTSQSDHSGPKPLNSSLETLKSAVCTDSHPLEYLLIASTAEDLYLLDGNLNTLARTTRVLQRHNNPRLSLVTRFSHLHWIPEWSLLIAGNQGLAAVSILSVEFDTNTFNYSFVPRLKLPRADEREENLLLRDLTGVDCYRVEEPSNASNNGDSTSSDSKPKFFYRLFLKAGDLYTYDIRLVGGSISVSPSS